MFLSAVAVVFKACRPAFLVLTPVCILAAVALVPEPLSQWPHLLAVLAGAMCAHMSVNLLNEYQDFHSGLDFNTRRTPFSGGSGALPAQPAAARLVGLAGIITLLVTLSLGLMLVAAHGTVLLMIGVCGVLLVVLYTGLINRLPWLCLVAPGLGFGPVMMAGTVLVLAPEQLEPALWASVLPFCLVNNLLLLNQYPDLDADAAHGRRTFPVVYGIAASNCAYAILVFIGYGAVMLAVVLDQLPSAALLSWLALPLSLWAWSGARTQEAQLGQAATHMAANVAAALLGTGLLALGVALSK